MREADRGVMTVSNIKSVVPEARNQLGKGHAHIEWREEILGGIETKCQEGKSKAEKGDWEGQGGEE